MNRSNGPAGQRPTDPFRLEHRAIEDRLSEMDRLVGLLPSASPAEQRGTMASFVSFLREHVLTHAEWEEKVLYPVVDRRAGSGENCFTASMRHEHAIVARQTNELAAEVEKAQPNAVWFARRADQLLGLLLAHLENEEEILLPVLDWTMTSEDFEREILSRGFPHPS
jgi:hemerythrin-like domain-containing protein